MSVTVTVNNEEFSPVRWQELPDGAAYRSAAHPELVAIKRGNQGFCLTPADKIGVQALDIWNPGPQSTWLPATVEIVIS